MTISSLPAAPAGHPPTASWPADNVADALASAREAAAALDSALRAASAPLSSGLSPQALALAMTDWALHLATQPAQALQLALEAQLQAAQALQHAAASEPPRADSRFAHPGWSAWPWSAAAHLHQAAETWWDRASGLPGMRDHHRDMARFFAARWLDALAPANLPLTNPEVLARTRERWGANLVDGARHAVDSWRSRHGLPPLDGPARPWRAGIDFATTPGRVVHRNRLVELIQYLPTTAQVQSSPVLIVPSWIMKYYILDLSPHNSLVRWLVDQGHTVLMVSWRNPDASDADLTMQDYLDLGVLDVLAAIGRLMPDTSVQACGYCLGGTLLAVAAAALRTPGRQVGPAGAAPLAGISLLAAETDFSEPGELGVLIDEAQVAMLASTMDAQGFLSGQQMAGAFSFLHARDLVWAERTRRFWLGEDLPASDLMAWNADVTRMPAAMHTDYLRRCYLHNDLAEGRYPVAGEPVSLASIDLPLFVVGTEKDHVAPWRSVFKLHRLTSAPLTFVLASGGHNAGIVSEPGHPNRRHALHLRPAGAPAPHPDAWLQLAEQRPGSWWPSWHQWLLAASASTPVDARHPDPAAVLADAPGTYIAVRYDD